jgi:hypothetical protein
MKEPQLKKTQFALLMADGATGHVLTTRGDSYHNDEKEIYLIFDRIEDVHSYIKDIHELRTDVEFNIYNSNQELVEHISAPKWR